MGRRISQLGWRSSVGEFKLRVVYYTGWSHKVAQLVLKNSNIILLKMVRRSGEVVVVGGGGAAVRVPDIFGTESDSGMCR